jgi:uncharacterized protein GlcG (DUF336 family)
MMKKLTGVAVLAAFGLLAGEAMAACSDVDRGTLDSVARGVVNAKDSGGFGLPMWVTVVDETGAVCHVVNTAGSGAAIGNSSWLGSRVISAQKANTANAFSLDGYAISTGILYSTVQDNASLFGLQFSNPVDPQAAYAGSPRRFGTARDPMTRKRVGGINVFGGGLALYAANGKKVGAIGVSGDTSCTDHVVAWKIRHGLTMDNVPAGFTNTNYDAQGKPLVIKKDSKGDEIIIDRDGNGHTIPGAAGWQHPACPNTPTEAQAAGAIIFD